MWTLAVEMVIVWTLTIIINGMLEPGSESELRKKINELVQKKRGKKDETEKHK